MAWVRIESAVARHRKFQQAGPAASWLWLCGLAYCQESLTDGFIPSEALPYLGVKRPLTLVPDLIRAGLWEPCDKGWHVHDYLDHQKSAATMTAISHERKKNGAAGGRASGESRRAEARREATDEAFAEVFAEAKPKQIANPDQIRSDQNRSDQTKTESAEPKNGSAPHVAVASVLEFSTIGQGPSMWDLTSEQVSSWADAYPGVDVLAECRHAKAWVDAQPERRKTAHGMPRFLVNWLNRSVERGGAKAHGPAVIEHPRSRTVGNAEALRVFVATERDDQ